VCVCVCVCVCARACVRACVPVRLRVRACAVCVCSVECLYHPSAWLDHDFEASILAPLQSTDIKFSFYPRQPIKYKDKVTFQINGLSRQSIEFMGQGTELQVLYHAVR